MEENLSNTQESSATQESHPTPMKKKSHVLLWGIIGICIIAFAGAFAFGKTANTAPVTQNISPKPTLTNTPEVSQSPTGSITATPKLTATPSLTPTKTPTLTMTPTATATQTVGNFGGHWVHNFGTMDITQTGVNVTGTYHNSFGDANGTVAGTVSGNTLTGTYQIGGSGPISFTLGNGGSTFDGNWGGSTKWCGARSGSQFPEGCAFSGHWNINIPTFCPAGAPSSVAEFNQTDSTVTGTYCNGTVTGTVSYAAGKAVVHGTYHANGGGTGDITFYLNGYSSMQYQGNYSSGAAAWCGWRNSSSQPSPCQL